jgi:hypothetical protein
MATEIPESVTGVLMKRLDREPYLAHVFLHTRDVPELPQRRRAGLRFRHAPSDVVPRFGVDVVADLLTKLIEVGAAGVFSRHSRRL